MKVAAIGDLHCTPGSRGMIRSLLEGVEDHADILVLAGDLTNMGLVEEMEVLLDELSHVSLPIVAVMGNHDHENGNVELLTEMISSTGVAVLDNSSCVISSIGFVGTKGFCGGFGERRVQAFGESAIKAFIQTSVDETVHLESAIKKSASQPCIAVLHYAPISQTLEGESLELYPFLGTSLLAAALDRHPVKFVVHGHAHHGYPQGFTSKNIPVYNVARFVLTRFQNTAYRIFEV
nr:metallophosphoesterase [Deltaproteobacteria bacterium]